MTGVLNEPCRDCGQLADRLVGTAAVCHRCAEVIVGPIRERVLDRQGYVDGCPPGTAGIGHIAGRHRPDHAADVYELRCTACSATWCGRPGDPCGWCLDLHAAIRTGQREILLQPPDIDHTDLQYGDRMKAWGDRLARAVEADILTEHEAHQAWNREVGRAAAS